jgi:uncharacterized membrane protein
VSKPYATTFGGLAALLAGILWVSWVLIGLFLNPIHSNPNSPFNDLDPPFGYLAVAAYSLAMVFMAPGLLGLRVQQRGWAGTLGRFGMSMSFMGAIMSGIGTFAHDLLRVDLAGLWVQVPGFLLLILGLLFLSFSAATAIELPPWHRWSFLAIFVAFTLGGQVGVLLLGPVWIALGYFLLSGRGARGSSPAT